MGACLVEYKNGVNPIYDNDELSIGKNYRYILDTCRANGDWTKCGSIKKGLRKTLNDTIKMLVNATKDEYEYVEEALVKELTAELKADGVI